MVVKNLKISFYCQNCLSQKLFTWAFCGNHYSFKLDSDNSFLVSNFLTFSHVTGVTLCTECT